MTSLNLYCYSFVPSTCTLKRLDKAGLWCIEGISDKANFYHSYFYNSLEQKRQNSIYCTSKIFYSLTFFFFFNTNIIIKKKKITTGRDRKWFSPELWGWLAAVGSVISIYGLEPIANTQVAGWYFHYFFCSQLCSDFMDSEFVSYLPELGQCDLVLMHVHQVLFFGFAN